MFAVGPLGTGLLFAARGLGALIGPLLLRRVLTHRTWLLPGLAISMVAYGLAYLGRGAVARGSGSRCVWSSSPTSPAAATG